MVRPEDWAVSKSRPWLSLQLSRGALLVFKGQGDVLGMTRRLRILWSGRFIVRQSEVAVNCRSDRNRVGELAPITLTT